MFGKIENIMPRKIVFILLIIFFSCKAREEKSLANVTYQIRPSDFAKDFDTWYRYDYYNILLARDFLGENISGEPLEKDKFLQKLQSGDFMPIKTALKDSVPVYRLFNYSAQQQNINSAIVQKAEHEIRNSEKEGKLFPTFSSMAVSGKRISNETLKGKYTIVKCWFIHCTSCVAEFPELNKVAEENKGNNEILFMSLALDKNVDLIDFLKKKELDYETIGAAGNLIEDLGIIEFPTHLIVGKDGKIIKAVNSVSDLKYYVDKIKKGKL